LSLLESRKSKAQKELFLLGFYCFAELNFEFKGFFCIFIFLKYTNTIEEPYEDP